jgi:hypothetical protein
MRLARLNAAGCTITKYLELAGFSRGSETIYGLEQILRADRS